MVIIPNVNPPAHADMVMDEDWSGWLWPANDESGKEYWFLYYRIQGDSGGELKSFRNKGNLEQFMDFLDMPS